MQTEISSAHILKFQSRPVVAAISRWSPFWPAAIAAVALVAILSLTMRPDVSGPVHVDEWTNLAYAEVLRAEGSLPHADPLYGTREIGFRPETGFRVFLVELNMVTGLDWEQMFPALPALMMTMFVVTVLALGVSLRTGLFAGALAIGAPTTLRFLGPSFAVPVSLGLTIAVALGIILLTPGLKNSARAVIAPLLMAGLVLVHPPTALVASIAVAVIVGLGLLPRGKQVSFREQIPALITLVVPVIWFAALPGDVRSELLGETSVSQTGGQGLITNYLFSAGYFRVSLMALSLFFLMMSGFTASRVAFVAGIGLTLAFVRAHEMGVVGMANLYDRSWLYLDLLLTLGGAAGITAAISMAQGRRFPISDRWMHAGALGVIATVTFAGSMFARASEDVYRIADENQIEDFRWIKENLSDVRGLTLLDPDIAVSYPAIAGRPVFASSAFPRPSSEARVQQARDILAAPVDAALLSELGVAIVYDLNRSRAPGTTEVRPGIFVVDSAPGFDPGAEIGEKAS